MELYEFRNLKTIEDKTFEAENLLEALNLASKAWFGGSEVIHYLVDDCSRVTLIGTDPVGWVIARIYWER